MTKQHSYLGLFCVFKDHSRANKQNLWHLNYTFGWQWRMASNLTLSHKSILKDSQQQQGWRAHDAWNVNLLKNDIWSPAASQILRCKQTTWTRNAYLTRSRSNVNRLQQYIMYMYDVKKILLYWNTQDMLPHNVSTNTNFTGVTMDAGITVRATFKMDVFA